MIGTFFNVSTILIGSLLGNYFKKSFADKYQEILMQASCKISLKVNSLSYLF